MKNKFQRFLTALLLLVAFQQAAPAQSIYDEGEVKKILEQRITNDKKGVGIAIGIINEKGTKLISYGKMKAGEAREVDAGTIFEIGSITKVFTCILLAEMVERGDMNLADPISLYLPKSVKAPTRNGKEITLLDLATHTSGLPRMPTNFNPKDPKNPFADYTVEQLYAFLSSYTLTRDIGSKYDYSNVGMGLLGHILTLKAKKDFETLVVERICKPLGMHDTRVTLSAEQKSRLATGHTQDLTPTPNWDITTLAGAGALRSTVNDMLKFAAANLGLVKTKLDTALQLSHKMQRPTDSPNLDIALGWHINKRFGTEIIWHNGGTGGYRTFTGFDPKKRAAVVVLSNSGVGQDDIGLHILESQFPLQKFAPVKQHTEIKVDPKSLAAYVGEYQVTPAVTITVTQDGDRLSVQLTGQQRFEIFPEAETEFFLKVVDAQISFVKNDKGEVTQLILHQGGQNIPAKKVK